MSLRPELLSAPPYHFSAHPAPIKLDQNESAYDLPDALLEALRERLSELAFNRYPELAPWRLRARLAALHGWPEEGVVVAGGSNVLIQAFVIAGGIGRRVITVAPTFPVYAQQGRVLGAEVVELPLGPGFALPVAALTEALGTGQGVSFLANPAAPTGNAHPEADLEALAGAAAPRYLFVVDEAYQPFSDGDALELVRRHPHAVSLRTFSKALGLAGARLGYALAHPEVAREVQKAVLPFSVSALQVAVGEVVLGHPELLQARLVEIRSERARLHAALAALPGVTVYPSAANFLLLRVPDAAATHGALLAAGVVVRRQDHLPGLAGCLRVTVGAPKENDAFLGALRAHLAPAPEAARG